MNSHKGGAVLALLLLAVGLWAYRAGKLTTFGQALNGSMVVNR